MKVGGAREGGETDRRDTKEGRGETETQKGM